MMFQKAKNTILLKSKNAKQTYKKHKQTYKLTYLELFLQAAAGFKGTHTLLQLMLTVKIRSVHGLRRGLIKALPTYVSVKCYQ